MPKMCLKSYILCRYYYCELISNFLDSYSSFRFVKCSQSLVLMKKFFVIMDPCFMRPKS